jgi:hypothetical protein
MDILLTAVGRLWLSGYVENKDLVKHVQALNAARKAAIGANKNFHTTAVSLSVALNAGF